MKIASNKIIILFLGLCAFVMNITWFMSYPIFSIYLNTKVGMSFPMIGLILGGIAFIARFLPIVGGFIADRTSQLHCFFIGILIRSIGFIGFGFVNSPTEAVVALAVNAFGGVLLDPSVRALISQLPEAERVTGFIHLNLFLNSGIIVGPLIGALLSGYDSRYPFLISGFLLFLLAAGGLSLWSSLASLEQTQSQGWNLKFFVGPFLDPNFRGFAISVFFAGALLGQIHYTLPVYNYLLSGSLKDMSSVYTVNGIVGLIAMLLLKKQVESKPPFLLSAIGIFFVGVGLVSIPFVRASWWILLCISLFTIGETLVLPTHEIITSKLAPCSRFGQYFGTLEMCGGLGMTLATLIGPYLAEKGSSSTLPWVIFGVTAFLLFFYYLSRTKKFQVHEGGEL